MKAFAECLSRDVDSQNRWYAECQRDNLPYVWIEHRKKYAAVHWDCITLNSEREKMIDQDEANIAKELVAVFDGCSGKSPPYNKVFVGKVDFLPPAEAQIVAERVAKILRSRLN